MRLAMEIGKCELHLFCHESKPNIFSVRWEIKSGKDLSLCAHPI